MKMKSFLEIRRNEKLDECVSKREFHSDEMDWSMYKFLILHENRTTERTISNLSKYSWV